MKFFFDRCIPIRLVRMLAAFDPEHEIVHEDDDPRFDPRSEDVFIIETLAGENPKPMFLTGDLNMRSKVPHERKALKESGLKIVFFRKTFHNVSMEDQAVKLIKAWPAIKNATCRCASPTVFEVTVNGKIIRYCLTRAL